MRTIMTSINGIVIIGAVTVDCRQFHSAKSNFESPDF